MALEKKARTLRAPKENHKDLVEITTPKTIPFTPLGTLSVLPRELRDEIYSHHLYNHSFYFNSWQKYPHSKSHCKWLSTDVTPHRLSMSAVSKHIRQEFLIIVYAEAVFTIRDEYLLSDYVWERHDIPFIDHIQNLELQTSLGDSYCWYCRRHYSAGDDNLPMKKAVPTLFFTGTRILRNTCVIQLESCTPKRLALLLRSPFFHVIKQLTNFKSVTLQLVSEKGWWVQEDVDTYLEQCYVDHAVQFRVLVDAISNALEPSLGPSVSSGPRNPISNCWNLTFRPRDYLSKKKSLEAQLGAQKEEQAADLTVIEGNE